MTPAQLTELRVNLADDPADRQMVETELLRELVDLLAAKDAEIADLLARLDAREMAADEAAVAAERERADTAEAEVTRLRLGVQVTATEGTISSEGETKA